MAAKKVVGIGRVVLNRRERMLMLQPRGKGILATTLRYPYEVRQDAEYFADIADIKLPEDMMGIAEVIIERKSGHFEPDEVHRPLRRGGGEPAARPSRPARRSRSQETPAPSKVVNIMDALKRSLEAEGGGAADVRRPRAPSKKPAEVEKPAAAEKKAEIRKPKARKAR